MAKYHRDRRDKKNVTDGTHWKCTQFAKNGLLLLKTKLCCQSWFRTSLNIWKHGLWRNVNCFFNLDEVYDFLSPTCVNLCGRSDLWQTGQELSIDNYLHNIHFQRVQGRYDPCHIQRWQWQNFIEIQSFIHPIQ